MSPEQLGSSYSQQDMSSHPAGDETKQALEALASYHGCSKETQFPDPFRQGPRWEKNPTVSEKSPNILEKSPTVLEKHPIETAGPSNQDCFRVVQRGWGPLRARRRPEKLIPSLAFLHAGDRGAVRNARRQSCKDH